MSARVRSTLMLVAALVPLGLVPSPASAEPAEFSHRHLPGGGVFVSLPVRLPAPSNAVHLGHLQVDCARMPVTATIALIPYEMDRLHPAVGPYFVVPHFEEAMRLCANALIHMDLLAQGFVPVPRPPFAIPAD